MTGDRTPLGTPSPDSEPVAHAGPLSIPALEADTDTLAAAMAYAAAGWYVLPVDPGTKHPGSVLGKGWPAKSSRDVATLVAWFAGSNAGVALHLGRSGAIAFDVDNPGSLPAVLLNAFDRDRPPFQSTRSNGPGRGHSLYVAPPGRQLGNSTGKLGDGWGDVRGRNGIIVVAPSEHMRAADGGRYSWLTTGDLPMLPSELAELLPEATPADDAATDTDIKIFLAQHTGSDRPELMKNVIDSYKAKVGAGKSRHDSAVRALVWGLKEARAGCYPADRIHEDLRSAFEASFSVPNSRQADPGEWAGITAWAVGQALAADVGEVRRDLASRVPPPGRRTACRWPRLRPGTSPGTSSLTQCRTSR